MEEIYPKVIINVIGGTAPFQYEVSLKYVTNRDAPTALIANIRTGIFDTIDQVIACFEWELSAGLQELIRDNLANAIGVEFNLQDGYN